MFRRSPRLSVLLMMLCLLWFSAPLGCGRRDGEAGFDIPEESKGEVHSLVLENQSQFVIQEIHVHAEPSFASGSSLQIASNLEPQDRWEITSFTSGDYITFVRERPDGRALSVTTAAPVFVDAAWYRVLLLDNAFRVLEPAQ